MSKSSESYVPDNQELNYEKISQATTQDLRGRQSDKDISIENAILRLDDIEDQETHNLIDNLSPIRISAQAGLETIGSLADDLRNEEIKVEDERFESTVENARNTVITSILKDANSTFPEINSYNDALKFKDRLESLTNRFGQLTGSHSKLFNVFMKKYAGKFRSEFEDFSNLNKKTSKIIKNFEAELEDVKDCRERLTNLSSDIITLKDSEERIAIISAEVRSLEDEIDKLTRRRQEIERSDEYRNYSALSSKAREIENDKAEFREYVSDLFSHLNRAFTKYSYGVSKSVSRKIDTLSNTPWEIFLDHQDSVLSSANTDYRVGNNSRENNETIEAYRILLVEIRGAVSKGVISLKDSDKVLTYLDRAIELFPKLKSRGKEIEENASAIRKKQNPELFDSIQDLDQKIRRNKGDLYEKKSLAEELRNGLNERKDEIRLFTDECNNLLTEVIGEEKTISSI